MARSRRGTAAGRRAGAAAAAAFGGSGSRIVLNQAALNQLLHSPDGAVGKDVSRRAIEVERGAKRRCPVDTGRLRASITWRLEKDDELVGVIGSNVEYAAVVELTNTPYLRDALGAANVRVIGGIE